MYILFCLACGTLALPLNTTTENPLSALVNRINSQLDSESGLISDKFDLLSNSIEKDIKDSRDDDIRQLTEALLKHSALINKQFEQIAVNLQKTFHDHIGTEASKESDSFIQKFWKLF